MSNKKRNMEMNRALLDGLSRVFIRNDTLKILDQLREKLFGFKWQNKSSISKELCVFILQPAPIQPWDNIVFSFFPNQHQAYISHHALWLKSDMKKLLMCLNFICQFLWWGRCHGNTICLWCSVWWKFNEDPQPPTPWGDVRKFIQEPEPPDKDGESEGIKAQLELGGHLHHPEEEELTYNWSISRIYSHPKLEYFYLIGWFLIVSCFILSLRKMGEEEEEGRGFLMRQFCHPARKRRRKMKTVTWVVNWWSSSICQQVPLQTSNRWRKMMMRRS